MHRSTQSQSLDTPSFPVISTACVMVGDVFVSPSSHSVVNPCHPWCSYALVLFSLSIFSSAVGPSWACPLIDSLPGADNAPPVIVLKSSLPDRFKDAV